LPNEIERLEKSKIKLPKKYKNYLQNYLLGSYENMSLTNSNQLLSLKETVSSPESI
jgi:hypothetical protein